MRSCYLEGREGSQHKNEAHTCHKRPVGPRQNHPRQARRTEPPPTKVEGFSGLERLRRTVEIFFD
jgi:hypothetical protein